MRLSILLLVLTAFSCTVYHRPQIGFPAKSIKLTEIESASVVQLHDFEVRRLSGKRVQLSWHTYGSKSGFVIVRKNGRLGMPEPIVTIEPKSENETLADYRFTDINAYEDSSFYSVLQEDSLGRKYYSKYAGVNGIK